LFLEFGFPEFTTLFLILRQVIAPLVVISAFVPVAVAAHESTTRGGSTVGAALETVALPLVIVGAALAFLRSRKTVNG
jgi:hypothetical protein